MAETTTIETKVSSDIATVSGACNEKQNNTDRNLNFNQT